MFNLRTQSKIYLRETIKFWLKTIVALKPVLGKILLTLFLPTYQRQNFYIEDFVYISVVCEATIVRSRVDFKISARGRQSSVSSNTLWACINFFGQIIVQRYFFVCPQWSSRPYISKTFIIWTHFVNASWKKSDPRMHISSTTQENYCR